MHPTLNPSTRPSGLPGDQTVTQLMTAKEVADYFSISQVTIYKYAAEGKIPALRVGRVWRFDKQAIDKWVCGKSNAEGADNGSHECA